MAEPTSLTRQVPDAPAVDGGQPSPKSGGDLRERVRQLEQVVVSHAMIDQASGVLMAWTRCSPQEAWAKPVRVYLQACQRKGAPGGRSGCSSSPGRGSTP
ncbi:ANTAR domain-containing protein [Streptomyces microflavus]|uniref:ANTAR domain-containing protein n=1 Tax=Streptomyces microflavus TaxID=1919 RepID=UPI0036E471DB